MTLNERHLQIMDMLRGRGSISVTTLAEKFKVSEVTIRKDLNMLEKQNILYRTHGSAVLINAYINDRHISEKESYFVDEKSAIGRQAIELVSPNDTILIASGTTVMFFARQLLTRTNIGLTVITAAINVASILSKDKNIDIIQLGGVLRNSSVSAVGSFAESMLNNFSCSKLFIGVDGIDVDFGITTTNVMEANLNRVMINCVQKVVVLSDSSKFGRRGLSKICDIESVDLIITDDQIPSEILTNLTDRGIEVITVKASKA